ncbi:uncharacterized protein GGS22DRAFT_158566 [Annulohypoxylon maeteangense]|uniref:uncharacterized protein n=1 Tax=Annulohypoxylon maeteangense TaxID=1927788 RepID=UPI0020089127|nr:uncharacterized protein GGS22DRAFT_158566 [Annulohypoxylon maeteangense]KAI0886729.1 hypothetical protein GGS22DRAFT_158566 [Annulohypoxylon maeteangense]
MGQGASHHEVRLETRVENPPGGNPQGLALIAHGRFGGTFDQPPVRLLAEYLTNERLMRVVTWNARGIGQSEGGNEWTDFSTWIGDAGINDYRRMLRESMTAYVNDFPKATEIPLFLCGYSAGAVFAGCTRPSPSFPQFSPAHYILISYPVDMNPFMAMHKTGSYFRSLEALVQGYGWENLPEEFNGKEPDVAGVFTVMGQFEGLFYHVWTGILGSKNARNILRQVVVEGADHAWNGKAPRIVEEVDKWLCKH